MSPHMYTVTTTNSMSVYPIFACYVSKISHTYALIAYFIMVQVIMRDTARHNTGNSVHALSQGAMVVCAQL